MNFYGIPSPLSGRICPLFCCLFFYSEAKRSNDTQRIATEAAELLCVGSWVSWWLSSAALLLGSWPLARTTPDFFLLHHSQLLPPAFGSRYGICLGVVVRFGYLFIFLILCNKKLIWSLCLPVFWFDKPGHNNLINSNQKVKLID